MFTSRVTVGAAIGAYLSGIQFLFLLTWIVYVVYLGDLLAAMGWPKEWVTRLLLLDQILFVLADVALGFYADRALRLVGRMAPWILTLNLLSCLVFVSMPHLTGLGVPVFIAATVTWLLTASVLRAPMYGLIARHANGRGNESMLLGLGLASALGPYLGVALKSIDPALAFGVSGVALALMTLAYPRMESEVLAASPPANHQSPDFHQLWRWLPALLLLALGFQVHVFINSAGLYKTVADAAWLPWLMPVFWIGFSLAVYPGAALANRWGARGLLWRAAGLGALATLVCTAQPDLNVLLGAQALAGAAWGGVFLAGLMLAGMAGSSGRENLFVGVFFASLAIAAASRIGLNLGMNLGQSSLVLPLPDTLALAAACWLGGAVLIGLRQKSLKPTRR